MTTTYEEAVAQTRDLLAKGNAKEAFALFRPQLSFPGALETDARWEEALELFAGISDGIGDTKLGALLRDTARTYNDPNALWDLGYQLVERRLHDFAATVLARSNLLGPGRERTLSWLVRAFEEIGRHDEVCRALKQAKAALEKSAFLRYLLAFNAVMTRDLAEATAHLPGLLETARTAKHEDFPFMAKTIEGFLARAQAVREVTPLDETDLRGWHFVVNGSLVLHLSPFGFAEGMRGRYGFINDTPALCHEGILRLLALLQALDVAVPRVFLLPDRDSEALGRAAAKAFGIPTAPWKDGHGPGLVVAYDLLAVEKEVRTTLASHAPGQVLWAHTQCWTQRMPFGGDAVTMLQQARLSPWDGGFVQDPATKELRRGKPGEGTPEQLAERIVGARVEPDALADLAKLVALARAACKMTGEHAPGLVRREGTRRNAWAESPVASSRFG